MNCSKCGKKLDVFGDCDNCISIKKAETMANMKKASILIAYQESNPYDEVDIVGSLSKRFHVPRTIIESITGHNKALVAEKTPQKFCSCGISIEQEMTFCWQCKEKVKKVEEEKAELLRIAPAMAWIEEQESKKLNCRYPEFGDMPLRFTPVLGSDCFAMVYKTNEGQPVYNRNEDGELCVYGGGVGVGCIVRDCPASLERDVKNILKGKIK